MWRHPLLRGEGVCTQANMYKYFKSAVIRNPLFTLYYFLPHNGVTWNVYEDDKWRRLYCLFFSMILIIIMLMMKWWSDSIWPKHSNHHYQVATSILFPRKIICAILFSWKELRICCSSIGHNNTKHSLCLIRNQHSLDHLEMVRWESVPRGSSGHAWKLSSRVLTRPDWLPLGLRGWLLTRVRTFEFKAIFWLISHRLLIQHNFVIPQVMPHVIPQTHSTF